MTINRLRFGFHKSDNRFRNSVPVLALIYTVKRESLAAIIFGGFSNMTIWHKELRGLGDYFATLQFRHLHYKLAKNLQIVPKISKLSAETLVLSLQISLNICFSFGQIY